MSDAEHLGLTTIQLTSTLGKRIDRLKAELDFQIKDNWKLTTELMVSQNENANLRELCADMWRLIEDLDATPYVTERQGNNPAVTWLDEDWSVHESCKKRIRELGIEVDE